VNERDQIYVEILRYGMLKLREVAHMKRLECCEVEAEHLHNIPSLIGETNDYRHAYYIDSEVPFYLERVDRAPDMTRFALARFEPLWARLRELRRV